MHSLIYELNQRSFDSIDDAQMFVRSITNNWLNHLGLPVRDLSNITFSKGDSLWLIASRVIDVLLGDTNLIYKDKNGNENLITTWIELHDRFLADYLTETVNWFYNPILAAVKRVCEKLDSIVQSVTIFQNLSLGVDTIFKDDVFLFEAKPLPEGSTIIAALKDILGWPLTTRLDSSTVEGEISIKLMFNISLIDIFNIIKAALSSSTGMAYYADQFDKRSMLDVILRQLIACPVKKFSYEATKDSYLTRTIGLIEPYDSIFGRLISWRHPYALFWVDLLEFGVQQYRPWVPIKGGM